MKGHLPDAGPIASLYRAINQMAGIIKRADRSRPRSAAMLVGNLFRYLGCGLLTIPLLVLMIAGTVALARSNEDTLSSYVRQERCDIVDVVTLAASIRRRNNPPSSNRSGRER